MKKQIGLVAVLLIMALPVGATEYRFVTTPDAEYYGWGMEQLEDGFGGAAMTRFKQAAEYGNKDAQRNIGIMYFQGEDGIEKDMVKALAWLSLAAHRGSEKTAMARDEIAAMLTEEQLEQASRLVNEELAPKYGYQAAVEKREEWARKQKREVTGSRTGSVGNMQIEVYDRARGIGRTIPGHMYFREVEQYVADLTIPSGNVAFGDFEVLEDEPED